MAKAAWWVARHNGLTKSAAKNNAARDDCPSQAALLSRWEAASGITNRRPFCGPF